MKVMRFKCLSCGTLRRSINGSPARCPSCRKTSAWITVEVEVKEDKAPSFVAPELDMARGRKR